MKVVTCGLFCSSQKRSCQVKKKEKNQGTITLLTFILIKSHNDRDVMLQY